MKRILLFGVLLLVAACNLAAQSVWKLDKAHSQVRFSVAHFVISEVSGRFKDFDLTFDQSKDDFTDAKIEATIKAASIDTDNERRDKHLLSDDFFDAEEYPEIKFKSTSIEKTGEGTYKITGDLTIRGVTKPVILDTKFKGMIKDARGGSRIAFKATTTIDRFEFGTKWKTALDNGGLVAGKDVEITLTLELKKEPESKG